MAHAEETRRAVRSAYIYDQLPLERAAVAGGVPASTAARWKRKAKAEGDDWDKARLACALMSGATGGVESVTRQMLADYLVQHKALIDQLRDDTDSELSAAQKADILASLADSFNKTVSACRKVMPETNELAIALEVLALLGEFVREHFPERGEALVAVLEPFGHVLSQHYGSKGNK
jgi:hypothetical protein